MPSGCHRMSYEAVGTHRFAAGDGQLRARSTRSEHAAVHGRDGVRPSAAANPQPFADLPDVATLLARHPRRAMKDVSIPFAHRRFCQGTRRLPHNGCPRSQ